MNEEKLLRLARRYAERTLSPGVRDKQLWQDRQSRRAYYTSFTREKLLALTEEGFTEYIGQLWAMVMWGDKRALARRLMEDNGFDTLKLQLAELLYGDSPLPRRWDEARAALRGLGPGALSELMSYEHADACLICNRAVIGCLTWLGVEGLPRYLHQYTGDKYAHLCAQGQRIAQALRSCGMPEADLLTADYFLWDAVQPAMAEPDVTPVPDGPTPLLHNELRDAIATIGRLLGYEARIEAALPGQNRRVDVVWEAAGRNGSKLLYVFEVQCSGSIDLIQAHFLQALRCRAVQAVVAVSDTEQLEQMAQQFDGVIPREVLRLWNVASVLQVRDDLTRTMETLAPLLRQEMLF